MDGKKIEIKRLRGVHSFAVDERAIRAMKKDPRLNIGMLEKDRADLMRLLGETNDQSLIPGIVLRDIILSFQDVLSSTDMDFARKYIRQLELSIGRDRLTSARNKRVFERDMEHVFSQDTRDRAHGRESQPYALCIVDVDFFKKVNTLGGLPAGDIALQELSAILHDVCKRGTDRVYRFGGEEFAVLVANTPLHEVQRLMETVRARVQAELLERVLTRMPEGSEKERVRTLTDITVSIGIEEKGAHLEPRPFFENADRALYGAKKGLRTDNQGRNQVQTYGSDFAQITPTVQKAGIPDDMERVKGPAPTQFPIFDRPDREIYTQYLDQKTESGAFPTFYMNPMLGIRALARALVDKTSMERVENAHALQAIESALEYIQETAHLDPLTSLPNLNAHHAECHRVWSEMQRQGTSHGYVIFDIDFFKKVNDELGHSVGDLALRAFGRVLKKRMRKNETVARIGGEEFSCIFSVDSEEEFKRALERLRTDIERDVIRECKKVCAEEGITVDWDREQFTASFAGVYLVPRKVEKGQHESFTVPSEQEIKALAAATLLLAKSSEGVDIPPTLTSRTGPVGRNRWVIARGVAPMTE